MEKFRFFLVVVVVCAFFFWEGTRCKFFSLHVRYFLFILECECVGVCMCVTHQNTINFPRVCVVPRCTEGTTKLCFDKKNTYQYFFMHKILLFLLFLIRNSINQSFSYFFLLLSLFLYFPRYTFRCSARLILISANCTFTWRRKKNLRLIFLFLAASIGSAMGHQERKEWEIEDRWSKSQMGFLLLNFRIADSKLK